MKPSRNNVDLTRMMSLLPDSLQRSATLAAVKDGDRLSGGSCFEPVTSKYLEQLDANSENSSEQFLKFLLDRGYDHREAHQVIRRDIAAFPSVYSVEEMLRRCAGSDAAARTVLAQALNAQWLRLWRARLKREDSASLLSATARVAAEVFFPQDMSYLALRTALAAWDIVKDEESVTDEDSEIVYWLSRFQREALAREATQLSRGRLKEASSEAVTAARLIVSGCRAYAEAAGSREQELDEAMRNIFEMRRDEDFGEEGEEDFDEEIEVDLTELEVARLPMVSSDGSRSIFGNILGDVMIYERESAEAAYVFAMATVASVILVSDPSQVTRYLDPLPYAIDASIAAMIMAYGRARTIPSRRQGGNADRIWDPSEASIKVLELWRSIFPVPDLASIL